jgi:hypothetical protein
MASSLISPATGRVERIGMTLSLLSGVLIQLIGFGDLILQGCLEGGKLLQEGLDLMTSLQQVPSVNPQLLSQGLGRHPLSEAPQDQHDHRTRIAGASEDRSGEDRSGEEVVNGSTLSTPIVLDRRSMSVVRSLTRGKPMALRTGEPFREESVEQVIVTGLLVQQLVNREDHVSSPDKMGR